MLENNHLVRSFGRIKSRKLSDHKKFLFANLLPKYEVTFDKQPGKIWLPELSNFHGKFKEVHLEIGFGFGDFLFEIAKRNPDIYFLGCETHINGIVNLLAKLECEPLDNIGIYKYDARLILNQFQEKIFSKIYILFPDPWPKLRHYKRRLINIDLLRFLAEKMLPKAKLIIATDHDQYKKWIMIQLINCGVFKWQAKSKSDWQNFPEYWIKTKYQRKAENEGRKSVIFLTEKLRMT